jgi:hypothetical protein
MKLSLFATSLLPQAQEVAALQKDLASARSMVQSLEANTKAADGRVADAATTLTVAKQQVSMSLASFRVCAILYCSCASQMSLWSVASSLPPKVLPPRLAANTYDKPWFSALSMPASSCLGYSWRHQTSSPQCKAPGCHQRL